MSDNAYMDDKGNIEYPQKEGKFPIVRQSDGAVIGSAWVRKQEYVRPNYETGKLEPLVFYQAWFHYNDLKDNFI